MNLGIHVGGVGLAMLTVAAPAPVSAQAQPDFSKVEITTTHERGVLGEVAVGHG